jgi:DNA-binding IclR family transcriptional regulator
MKHNQSVQKAVAILRAAGAQAAGETASGLARAAGLPQPTALRLIHTLEVEGFLMRLPTDGRYVLGLDMLRLGRGAETGELLIAVTRRALAQLAEQTLETATLSVPRGRAALEVVLQVDGPHLIGPVDWVGGRYPLHATSGGKVLLASWEAARLEEFLRSPLERCASKTITDPAALREEIEQVRVRGYSVMVDELEDGLAALGAPVFASPRGGVGDPGQLVGILNLSGPGYRFDAAARDAAAPRLIAAAEAVARLVTPHA